MKQTVIAGAGILVFVSAGLAVLWQKDRSNAAAEPAPNEKHELAASKQVKPKSSRFELLTDVSIHPKKRVDLLRRIKSASLSQHDASILYGLLSHQPETQHREDWWLIVNEIMDQLRRHEIEPERYPEALLAIIKDEQNHQVLRDYAVQHLGLWCLPKEDGASEEAVPLHAQVPEVLETFGSLIREPDLGQTSIPGTTLNLFVNMQSKGFAPEVLQPVLDGLTPWLESVVTGESEVILANRVTAINVAGELGVSSLTPTIRSLVADENTDPTIRLNAIASLGHLGSEQDRDTLSSIAQSSSKFRFAAKSALKNLNQ